MANKDAVGAQGPAFEMALERGKIREFAQATKSRHPGYLEDRQPVIEPTFLMTSAFWQPPDAGSIFKDIDLDPRRILHGEQEFRFPNGPPRAGATLTAQTKIEEVYEKEGKRGGSMTFVVFTTEFRDEQGNLVAESRNTAIETGRAPTQEG